MLGSVRRFIWRVVRRGRLDREMSDEFAHHIELRADDLVRAGLAEDDALRRARLEFGNVTAAQESAREAWGTQWIDRLRQDCRYALRTLRRNPGFASIAILSLGLGIGAVTAVFSVINALDFRPLPFKSADQLVWLAEVTPLGHDICSHCPFPTSGPTLHDWVAQSTSFSAVGAVSSGSFGWEHGDVTESLTAERATPGFFAMLGAYPTFGRGFVAADTVRGALPVAVVSYEFWEARLGGDPRFIGTQLTGRGGTRYTIVGVLPRGFRFRDDAAIWTPLQATGTGSRNDRLLTAVARLKPGRTLAQSNSELEAITRLIAGESPSDFRGWTVQVGTLRSLLTAPVGKGRFVLFAITVLVLIIALLNVAGLLLGRAVGREQEMAMRTALGAGRSSLFRQMLVEGACIGVTGGALGVWLAVWAVRAAPHWIALDAAGIAVSVDQRVLLFALVISLAVGTAAALLPALKIGSLDLNDALRRHVQNFSQQVARTSNVLIALQVAVALAVVTAAGILSRDFLEWRYFDLGYRPDSLYFTFVSGTGERAKDPAAWRLVAEGVRERIAAIPGIGSATLEYRNASHPTVVHPAEGTAQLSASQIPAVKGVDPTYFTTFGTPVLAGRNFGTTDGPGSASVAIVNRAAARAFWPGGSALGKRIFVGDSISNGELLIVVGVVEDAERGELEERHWPMVYRPMQQTKLYHAAAGLYVRCADCGNGALLAAERAVRESTGRSATPFKSVIDALDTQVVGRQSSAVILDAFAVFGLLLAAMGVYGSVAYAASRRVREIGIRVALGAPRRTVVQVVARRGLIVAGIGVGIGIVSALLLARVMRLLVVATSPMNGWILAGAALLMLCVAGVAAILPAIRATAGDVLIALRAD